VFHLNERIAIWPEKNASTVGPAKPIALRDFYSGDGVRFGMLQAMGLPASYGNIVHYLNQRFDRSFLKSARALRELTRIPALVASRVLGDARVFVGILEDLLYQNNRVVVDSNAPDTISFVYNIADELKARCKLFRRVIKNAIGSRRTMFLTLEPELNFGHPCGTLRFSTSPKHGVLSEDCRSHDLENLYVADASFMPTSTGVNLSLTIAANAVRVAHVIAGSLVDLAPASPKTCPGETVNERKN